MQQPKIVRCRRVQQISRQGQIDLPSSVGKQRHPGDPAASTMRAAAGGSPRTGLSCPCSRVRLGAGGPRAVRAERGSRHALEMGAHVAEAGAGEVDVVRLQRRVARELPAERLGEAGLAPNERRVIRRGGVRTAGSGRRPPCPRGRRESQPRAKRGIARSPARRSAAGAHDLPLDSATAAKRRLFDTLV